MTPVVSIIIPTYNSAPYVTQAIDSILAQTYHDYELIVVDDGSTDDTATRVATYRRRLKYLHIAHSGCPALVRNAGIRIARGRYLAFLDADDRWLPDKLARQLSLMDSKPDVGLLCSNAYVVENHQDFSSSRLFSQKKEKSGWMTDALLHDCFICMSSVVIRREILDRSGWFHEAPVFRAVEDFDLWLRISVFTPIHYDPVPTLIYWDHHNTSIRGEKTPVEACKSILMVYDCFRRFLRKHDLTDLVSEDLWQDRYFQIYSRLFANYWTSGASGRVLSLGCKMVCLRPIAFIKLIARKIKRDLPR